MRLSDLIADLAPVESRGDLQAEIGALVYDSRQVARLREKSPLFFALSGQKDDGHHHIAEALKQGARALVVGKREFLADNVPALYFSDPREALARMASRFYGEPSRELVVVGVTGTNGKTTISYLLEKVLAAQGKICGVTGTVEYRFGDQHIPSVMTTPESVEYQDLLHQMRKHRVTHVISEISSHGLVMKRCVGVDFDVAIFANLTRDHLDFHVNMDEYFAAKAVLFTEHLRDSRKKNKCAILNLDDPYGARLARDIPEYASTYALHHAKADWHVLRASFSDSGTQATVHTPKGIMELKTNFLGEHNLSNCLAVMAAGLQIGLDVGQMVHTLANAPSVPGRLELVSAPNTHQPKVLVDYAHTPDALAKVLLTLRRLLSPSAKLSCVFGCGGDRDPGKRPLMAGVAAAHCDFVMITSDNPRTEDPEEIIQQIRTGIPPSFQDVRVEVDRRRAIYQAVSLLQEKDILLIAGKGHEKVQIIGKERTPFDDVLVARQALEARACDSR